MQRAMSGRCGVAVSWRSNGGRGLSPVFLTGTTSGLGRGFQEAFLTEGRRVLAINRPSFPRTLAEGPRLRQITANVRDREMMHWVVRESLGASGLPSLFVLNAGLNEEDHTVQFDGRAFRDVMETNLYGVLNVVEAAMPVLLKRGYPATFVCISSVNNFYPNPRCLGYYASKLLLLKLFQQFQRRYGAFGYQFKTVVLGPVATNIHKNPGVAPKWQQWVLRQITVSVEQAVSAIMPFINSNRLTLYYPKTACAVHLGARLVRGVV